jgi:hypothetical protein
MSEELVGQWIEGGGIAAGFGIASAASRGLMRCRVLRRALLLHRAQPGVAVLLPSAANARTKAIDFDGLANAKTAI